MYKDDINLQDFFSLYNLFSTKRMSKSNDQFYPDFINSMGIQKSYSCFIILFLDSGDVVNMDLSNLHLQDDSLGKYNQKKFKSFFSFSLDDFLESFKTSEGVYFFIIILV